MMLDVGQSQYQHQSGVILWHIQTKSLTIMKTHAT